MNKKIILVSEVSLMFYDVSSIISGQGFDKYQSYTVEIYNRKGEKISYDSTTGKYEVISDIDSGNMLFYKYLFLLILF